MVWPARLTPLPGQLRVKLNRRSLRKTRHHSVFEVKFLNLLIIRSLDLIHRIITFMSDSCCTGDGGATVGRPLVGMEETA